MTAQTLEERRSNRRQPTLTLPESVSDRSCVPRVADKDLLKAPDHKGNKLEKFDTYGSINITATPDDDEMSYTCEAKHPAIPIGRPMRASAKLSVFCEYAPARLADSDSSANQPAFKEWTRKAELTGLMDRSGELTRLILVECTL